MYISFSDHIKKNPNNQIVVNHSNRSNDRTCRLNPITVTAPLCEVLPWLR